MAKFTGRRVSVGLGNESTRGTGVVPSHWLPHTSISFSEQTETVRSNAAVNQIADSLEKVTTEKWTEGDIEGEVRTESFGLILKALAGQDPSTSGSDPYTHDYTLQNDNEHGTLSISVQDQIGDQIFERAMLGSLSIEQSLTDFAMFTSTFMAHSPKPTTVTPSFASETKFTKKDLSVKIASNLAGLSGANALGVVEGITLEIEKNVDRDSVVGTVEPIDFLNFNFSVEGELTLKYEDRTYRDYFLDDTTKAMEIQWNAGSDAKLTFQFPLVDFIEWEPDYALDDVVRQTVPFKANYDLSGGNDIISTIELVNSTTSY